VKHFKLRTIRDNGSGPFGSVHNAADKAIARSFVRGREGKGGNGLTFPLPLEVGPLKSS